MPVGSIGSFIHIGKGAIIVRPPPFLATAVTYASARDACHANARQGKRCILKDCCRILPGTILGPDTVVPSFTVFGGIPGVCSQRRHMLRVVRCSFVALRTISRLRHSVCDHRGRCPSSGWALPAATATACLSELTRYSKAVPLCGRKLCWAAPRVYPGATARVLYGLLQAFFVQGLTQN